MSWRYDWWPRNRGAVIVSAVVVAALVGFWAAENVAVIPTTHTYADTVVSGDNWIRLPTNNSVQPLVDSATTSGTTTCTSQSLNITFQLNDVGSTFLAMPRAGTLRGTYWAPSGTLMLFQLEFGSVFCQSTNTMGSFDFSVNGIGPADQIGGAWFTVQSQAPVTVYVNGSYSYLAPLLQL